MCGTENYLNTDSNESEVDVNSSAVLCSLAVGIGCSQLRQFCPVLNMPPISPQLYQRTEIELSNIIESASTAEMEKVGTLEAQLAVEEKSLEENGFPAITVTSSILGEIIILSLCH